jgi:hypothetical protein
MSLPLQTDSKSLAAAVPTLTVSNMHIWKPAFVNYCKGRLAFRILNGTEVAPLPLAGEVAAETVSAHQQFMDIHDQRNAIVLEWLLLTVDDVNRGIIRTCATAHAAFTLLVEQHGKDSGLSTFQLFFELFNYRMPEGGDLLQHLKTMRDYQGRLDSQIAADPDLAFPDKLFAMLLLTTLPSSYQQVRDNMFQQSITLTTTMVYERLRTAGFMANPSVLVPSPSGHTVKKEEAMVAKPGARQDHTGARPLVKNPCTLYPGCKGRHSVDNCFRRKAELFDKGATSAAADTSVTGMAVHATSPSAGESCVVVVGEQMLAMALSGTAGIQAALDSGCTRHIFFQKNLFTHLHKLENPVPVYLADGSANMAHHAGDIVLSPHGYAGTLRLKNVLYVPEFKLNLVSLHAITEAGGQVLFKGTHGVVTC